MIHSGTLSDISYIYTHLKIPAEKKNLDYQLSKEGLLCDHWSLDLFARLSTSSSLSCASSSVNPVSTALFVGQIWFWERGFIADSQTMAPPSMRTLHHNIFNVCYNLVNDFWLFNIIQ